MPVDLRVEQWPIGRLVEYARNPRKNDDQIPRMVAALTEFGFRIPIVAKSDGLIVDGHLRLKAAKAMGMTEVPVAIADDLTEAQVKAFRLLANRSASWAEWDKELLTIELLDLDDMDFDLGLTGFDPEELEFYTGVDPDPSDADPDDVPETPVHPVTRLGDVWILGKHRVVCGDSTDATVVLEALAGINPSLMVTDAPYGSDYDPGKRGRATYSDGRKLSTGKNRAVNKPANDGEAAKGQWEPAIRLFPGDVAYVWHAGLDPATAQKALEEAGFEIKRQIIWAKNKFVVSPSRQYHWQHEVCFYAVRKSKKANWNGDSKQSTLWQIEKNSANTSGHATEKPVECMRRPIENNSSQGQVVYDPFLGAGTTLMAAELTGRTCYGIELKPEFVDVTLQRWSKFTDQQPVHEESGKTYTELTIERPYAE